MDNFKITKTILENINEQNDRINECVDIVNEYTNEMYSKTEIDNLIANSSSLSIRNVADGETFIVAAEKNLVEIVINKTSITINEGNSDTFSVYLSHSPNKNQIVNITKDNSDVTLSVSNLTFTPDNYNIPQTVTITVGEDDDGFRDETCNIILSSVDIASKILIVSIKDNEEVPDNIPVTSISLNTNSYTFDIGDTVQLSYTILPIDATNKNVIWSASNENCTVVNGLVTAKTSGECIITCTTEDGDYSDSCTITVNVAEVITITNLLDDSANFTTSTVGGMKWQKFNVTFTLLEEGSCKVVGSKEGSNGLFKYLLNDISSIPNYNTHVFYSKYLVSSDGINYSIKSKLYEGLKNASYAFISETGIPYGTEVWVKSCILIDLTDIYGSGNELTLDECNSIYKNVWNV